MAKKLWLGIVAGAAVGGAIALLDRETREKTFQKASNLKTDAQYLYYNRGEVKEQADGNFSKVKELISNVIENKEFYLEKISELKDSMPQLTAQIQQTKDAFTKRQADANDIYSEQVASNFEEDLETAEEKAKPEDVIRL